MVLCSNCRTDLPRSSFSQNQLRKGADKRCKACVGGNALPSGAVDAATPPIGHTCCTLPCCTLPHRVYFDGGSRPNPGTGGFGGGFYIRVEDESTTQVCLQLFQGRLGHCTSNIAEYLGLIYAMRRAEQSQADMLDVVGDSELVIRQMKGEYEVRDAKLKLLHMVASGIAARFRTIQFHSVPRERNTEADELASEAIETPLQTDPWRNFLCYYPSRMHRCKVSIGDELTWASTDVGASRSDDVVLIDAAFLATLLPDGPRMLRNLNPLCRDEQGKLDMNKDQPLYPGAINVLTAAGGNMNVLGVTSALVPLSLVGSDGFGARQICARAVVILDLPVPLHVASNAMHGSERVMLFGEECTHQGGIKAAQLPAAYRTHSFYTTDVVMLPF
jgi:ribonuclease HI